MWRLSLNYRAYGSIRKKNKARSSKTASCAVLTQNIFLNVLELNVKNMELGTKIFRSQERCRHKNYNPWPLVTPASVIKDNDTFIIEINCECWWSLRTLMCTCVDLCWIPRTWWRKVRGKVLFWPRLTILSKVNWGCGEKRVWKNQRIVDAWGKLGERMLWFSGSLSGSEEEKIELKENGDGYARLITVDPSSFINGILFRLLKNSIPIFYCGIHWEKNKKLWPLLLDNFLRSAEKKWPSVPKCSLDVFGTWPRGMGDELTAGKLITNLVHDYKYNEAHFDSNLGCFVVLREGWTRESERERERARKWEERKQREL